MSRGYLRRTPLNGRAVRAGKTRLRRHERELTLQVRLGQAGTAARAGDRGAGRGGRQAGGAFPVVTPGQAGDQGGGERVTRAGGVRGGARGQRQQEFSLWPGEVVAVVADGERDQARALPEDPGGRAAGAGGTVDGGARQQAGLPGVGPDDGGVRQ